VSKTATRPATDLRYTVFELSAFGSMRIAAELDAQADDEALREARRLVPHGMGELRQGMRTVCRFGRA
jgi:hypothetical protein